MLFFSTFASFDVAYSFLSFLSLIVTFDWCSVPVASIEGAYWKCSFFHLCLLVLPFTSASFFQALPLSLFHKFIFIASVAFQKVISLIRTFFLCTNALPRPWFFFFFRWWL
jgi:hypothetical protein